ncbi:MAG: DUF427 domain-containing protein [Gemmatimonadetes bacterium]|nr:DUF427 domain-containing protein [Gemmatimonadota bacterium]
MDDHFHQLGRPKVRVTVRLDDEVVALSERTILLKEFAHGRILDPVYYFPQEDVAVDKLRPTETQTNCPIKGDASYWTYSGEARAEEDLVWGYPEPIEYSKHIAGRMAFDARRVSIEVEPLDA